MGEAAFGKENKNLHKVYQRRQIFTGRSIVVVHKAGGLAVRVRFSPARQKRFRDFIYDAGIFTALYFLIIVGCAKPLKRT